MEAARPAAEHDAEQLARLLDAARAAIAGRRGGDALLGVTRGAPAGADSAIRDWMGSETSFVLAGTYAGATVGLAAAHLEGSGPTRVGVVDCCYVEPAARGVGVGTALVAAVLEWFIERGCSGADVAALPGDRHTKQLFERFGFSARLLVLHRRLP